MAEEEGYFYQLIHILISLFFLISSSFFAIDNWGEEKDTFLSLLFAD